jgi:hypothetical protein
LWLQEDSEPFGCAQGKRQPHAFKTRKHGTPADPLSDIDVAIYKVEWVMKGGAVADKTKVQPR